MTRLAIIISSLLYCNECFSQNEKLFTRDYNYRWYDSCNRKAKLFIEKKTDYKFSMHPMEWAQSQLDSNLLHTDTLINTDKHDLTVHYYNKENILFLVKTISTEPKNWSKRIVVYDMVGNLILKEGYSSSGSLVFRHRRGYYGAQTQFECLYYDTPLYRFRVYTKDDKLLLSPTYVCECNF